MNDAKTKRKKAASDRLMEAQICLQDAAMLQAKAEGLRSRAWELLHQQQVSLAKS